MFYGIIISMFYGDNKKHHKPHIHASYQGAEAVFSIPDGKMTDGKLKTPQVRLIQAWIVLHADELMADWELAANENNIFKIEPLK